MAVRVKLPADPGVPLPLPRLVFILGTYAHHGPIRRAVLTAETEKTISAIYMNADGSPEWGRFNSIRSLKRRHRGVPEYYNTWAEAHAALLDWQQRSIDAVREQQRSREAELVRLRALEPLAAELPPWAREGKLK